MKIQLFLLKFAFVSVAFVSMLAVFSIYRMGDLMMLWSFVFFSILYFLALLSNAKLLSTGNRDTLTFFIGWFVVFLVSIIFNSSIPDGTSWIYLLYACMFMLLKRDIQWAICLSFVKVLSVLLAAALIEFVIYQLTGIGVVLGNVIRPQINQYESFNHLILNLVSEKYDIVRFQFLANEPGLLGTLCGFLLFPTGSNKSLRFSFIVFLISGLLTYSLAFYVLAAIYFVSIAKSIRKIIVPLAIVGAILLYAVKDNFNELIIERIESGEADNRTSLSLDLYFAKAFYNGDLVLGVGAQNFPKEIVGDAAGGKVWIIKFGILGLLIIIPTYIIAYIQRRKGRLSYPDYIFLIAFWLSFYQRQTIAESYTMLVFLMMPLVTSGFTIPKHETTKYINNYSGL